MSGPTTNIFTVGILRVSTNVSSKKFPILIRFGLVIHVSSTKNHKTAQANLWLPSKKCS